MKIKSLTQYPQQLGDGRFVGASGTSSAEREYDLPELTKEDKRRVKRGLLQVVPAEDKQSSKSEQITKPTVTANDSSKGGTK